MSSTIITMVMNLILHIAYIDSIILFSMILFIGIYGIMIRTTAIIMVGDIQAGLYHGVLDGDTHTIVGMARDIVGDIRGMVAIMHLTGEEVIIHLIIRFIRFIRFTPEIIIITDMEEELQERKI